MTSPQDQTAAGPSQAPGDVALSPSAQQGERWRPARRHSLRASRVSQAFGVMLALLGAPGANGDIGVYLSVGAYATVVALLLYACVRARALLAATFTALFGVAYAVSLGDALAVGIARVGLYASPHSVYLALRSFVLFMVVTVGVALLLRRHRRARRVRVLAPHERATVDGALIIVVVIVALAAFATGHWTTWGAQRQEVQGSMIRLELLYGTSLFAASAFLALRRVGGAGPGWLARRRTAWAFALVLAMLVFALQSRRLTLATAAIVMFTLLDAPIRA